MEMYYGDPVAHMIQYILLVPIDLLYEYISLMQKQIQETTNESMLYKHFVVMHTNLKKPINMYLRVYVKF